MSTGFGGLIYTCTNLQAAASKANTMSDPEKFSDQNIPQLPN
jgi:hypothetical protein